ncbi:hypothetical protein QBC39DRAFT_71427 [Podospora conica]|nr:hypothetical protein QBC39DRAFT_71427 [Schizothecium conicum]
MHCGVVDSDRPPPRQATTTRDLPGGSSDRLTSSALAGRTKGSCRVPRQFLAAEASRLSSPSMLVATLLSPIFRVRQSRLRCAELAQTRAARIPAHATSRKQSLPPQLKTRLRDMQVSFTDFRLDSPPHIRAPRFIGKPAQQDRTISRHRQPGVVACADPSGDVVGFSGWASLTPDPDILSEPKRLSSVDFCRTFSDVSAAF